MAQRVFVDANVLFSRATRDWLFLLRQETDSMFQIHCTEDVLAETLYNLRRANPGWDGARTAHLRTHLAGSLDEILQDFDGSIEYTGDDPDDRHVHAAAVACNADILLTGDNGFKHSASADLLPYSVYTPDEFFVLIDDSSSQQVQRVTEKQRQYWAQVAAKGRPTKTLADALIDSQCPDFAIRVQGHLRTLSGPSAVKPRSRPRKR
jgi:hypothetical protein